MNQRVALLLTASLLCSLTLVACHKEEKPADIKLQTGSLKKAFPTAKIEASTNKTVYAEVPTLTPDGKPNIDFYVGAAANAMEQNDGVAAFKLITIVQKQSGLTAEQQMALHDSMVQLQQGLIRRANAGDPAAKRAIDELNHRKP
jgi:hypothetical protein